MLTVRFHGFLKILHENVLIWNTNEVAIYNSIQGDQFFLVIYLIYETN